MDKESSSPSESHIVATLSREWVRMGLPHSKLWSRAGYFRRAVGQRPSRLMSNWPKCLQ